MADEKPNICPTCGMYTGEEIIELSPAYMWDCPSCGRENFQRSILLAATEEDKELGIDPNDYTWQTYPNVVICRHCEKQFKTRHVLTNDESESS